MKIRFLGHVLLLWLAWPCCAGVNLCHVFSSPNNGLNSDGANPAAGLVFTSGVLCGTTSNGGIQGAGTAFYLMPDASGFNAFRNFNNSPDAANPLDNLTFADDRFFGSTFAGGSSGTGTLFTGQTNGSVAVLHSFSAVNADTATNSGGASPNAPFISSGGTIFGATTAGGAAGNGTIYSLNTNGGGFAVLHDFSALDSVTGTNADGALPYGALVLSEDTLYGTTSGGGSGGDGVVFSVKTNGNNFTILHSFTSMDSVAATNADGAIPLSGVVLSNDTLYGAASAGGQGGRGTIFSIRTNGLAFTSLHHFLATDSATATNTDGTAPCARLTLSGNKLYGTASAGGSGASGTLFSLNTDGTLFKNLYNFTAIDSSTGANSDGAFPVAPLTLVGNSLFGTTFSGGPGTVGTIFTLPIAASPAIVTNILTQGSLLTLFFVGDPDSTNIIQATTNLEPPSWQNISTNVADSSGAWQFTDDTTNVARFYRSYEP